MAFKLWFLILLNLTISTPLPAFVHVNNSKPKLPVTRENPEIPFLWDGSFPKIDKKEEFANGAYKDLEDQDFFFEMLNQAFGKWNEVPGAFLTMTPSLDTDTVIEGEDSINAIVVESIGSLSAAAFANPINESTKPISELTGKEKDTNIIHDCDITVSDRAVDADELFSILIHEIGHCVGLGHPHTNYHSIMSYSRSKGASSLGLDDVAGTIFLYPNNNGDVKELVACSVIQIGKENFSMPFLILLLTLLPLVTPFVKKIM